MFFEAVSITPQIWIEMTAVSERGHLLEYDRTGRVLRLTSADNQNTAVCQYYSQESGRLCTITIDNDMLISPDPVEQGHLLVLCDGSRCPIVFSDTFLFTMADGCPILLRKTGEDIVPVDLFVFARGVKRRSAVA